jgi:hypothetical protein
LPSAISIDAKGVAQLASGHADGERMLAALDEELVRPRHDRTHHPSREVVFVALAAG